MPRLDDYQNDINSQLQSAWDARELKDSGRERVALRRIVTDDDYAERVVLAAGLTTASLECEDGLDPSDGTPQGRRANGQFTHDSKAMCACGHTFGTHTSAAPHDCTECAGGYTCDGFLDAEADHARLKRFAAVKELRSNNARIRRWLGR